jgi:hypothetical protein
MRRQVVESRPEIDSVDFDDTITQGGLGKGYPAAESFIGIGLVPVCESGPAQWSLQKDHSLRLFRRSGKQNWSG